MITDKLMQFVLSIYDYLFSQIPLISVDVPVSVINIVLEVLEMILFFFPVKYLAPIVVIICALWLLRFYIRLIRTIWDLLPIL